MTATQTAPSSTTASNGTTARHRLLLVDDHPIIREGLPSSSTPSTT